MSCILQFYFWKFASKISVDILFPRTSRFDKQDLKVCVGCPLGRIKPMHVKLYWHIY